MKMDPELLKLLNRVRCTVAERRTCVFEEKWGKFKSKASRKRFYDNQLKQIKVMKLEAER